jgi:hypothetical protein
MTEPAGPADPLVTALRELRVRAGRPSLRRLSRLGDHAFAASTIADTPWRPYVSGPNPRTSPSRLAAVST